jgi:hypothetical protein
MNSGSMCRNVRQIRFSIRIGLFGWDTRHSKLRY